LWDELVREAGADAVSPLINDALTHYLRRQRGLAAVATYEDEHGALTADEIADANRLLDKAGLPDLTRVPAKPRTQRRAKDVAASETSSRPRGA
jgi:hypothetical protein